MTKRVNPCAYGALIGIIGGLSGSLLLGAALEPTEPIEPVSSTEMESESVQSYVAPDNIMDDESTVVREDYLIDAPEFACPDGWTLAEDLSCVGPDFYGEPVEPSDTNVIQEDDPNFDCRFHGNEMCGVEIQGAWYVIQFEDGTPVSVRLR